MLKSLRQKRNLSVPARISEIREAAQDEKAHCFLVVRGPEGMLPDPVVGWGIRELGEYLGENISVGAYTKTSLRFHEASMHISNLKAPLPSTQKLIRRGIKYLISLPGFSSLRLEISQVLDSLGEKKLGEVLGGTEEEREQFVEAIKTWIRLYDILKNLEYEGIYQFLLEKRIYSIVS